MGACLCKTQTDSTYSKVPTKHDNDRDSKDIRHMNVSTIYLDSDQYASSAGDIYLNNMVTQHRVMKSVELACTTNAETSMLIDLYILDMQLILSNQYKDTEYSSFAVIPNKLHHLITSYLPM
eukprot:CAMPEP_0197033838 /NCGR_PEP_ID=MMETSP1384-20130603/12132_1 /TAXON_ID=29189 /ORGANISM="Ammonia sp." /LENGTH=121 /DNA_ID=CAMNT_0042463697 /DNA_START=28 /DNA_END=393 /DNA_ORIENTATION=-